MAALAATSLLGCTPRSDTAASAPPPVVVPADTASRQWQVPMEADQARALVNDYQAQKAPQNDPAAEKWLADWGIWGQNSDEQARALYQSIPRNLALKYVLGKPTRELVIFTDPYSQDDRRLFRLLIDQGNKLNAVLYVFPLSGNVEIGSVPRILCSQNPEHAFWDWMDLIAPSSQEAKTPIIPRVDEIDALARWKGWEAGHEPQLGCDGPARANGIGELASKMGVSFTPTLLFAHGRAWPAPYVELGHIQATWDFVHRRSSIPLSEPVLAKGKPE